ncbi:MAG: hypothetical protein QOH39_1127 [Verrucomicrobiota bacterium]|jgi:hypothetical protein
MKTLLPRIGVDTSGFSQNQPSLDRTNIARGLTQSPVLIMNRQPRSILEKYSREQVRQLYEHLHNDNPPFRYVFGLLGKASSEPTYKHADKWKRLPVSKSIDWAIRTIGGINEPSRRHAYVPLPNNPSGQSRWGGIDFDAHHEGELTRASDLAIRAFVHVVNNPFFTVLETSGVGFKLWIIANEFRDVSWWTSFLESIVRAIGTQPQSGVVELFPNREPSKYGKGLRAFGTWNPRNDAINQIVFENLLPLLDEASTRERTYLSSTGTPPSISRGTKGFEQFRIRERATRHNQLLALIGKLHVMYCHDLGRSIAEWQFNTKAVDTNADSDEHLNDFELLWQWSIAEWRKALSMSEEDKFKRLSNENERAAFRIIRDFHRSASHSGHSEFPISRDSLAERLQMTGEGAGKLRVRFCKMGIIILVKSHIPNRQCAYYRWTA